MENKNNLREVTPRYMRCIIGACPSIYEEVTPKNMQCVLTACPQIHKGNDSYLIVGEQVNPSDVGLEGKVGEGEVLIKVPKTLIDRKEK